MMLDAFDQALVSATNVLAVINDALATGVDFSLTTFIGAALIAIGVVTLVAAWPLDADTASITVPAQEQLSRPRTPAGLVIRPDASGGHSIPSTVAVARTCFKGAADV
jgi:hypothetical protein